MKKCSSADTYKGLIAPKCGCDSCKQKWLDTRMNVFRSFGKFQHSHNHHLPGHSAHPHLKQH